MLDNKTVFLKIINLFPEAIPPLETVPDPVFHARPGLLFDEISPLFYSFKKFVFAGNFTFCTSAC